MHLKEKKTSKLASFSAVIQQDDTAEVLYEYKETLVEDIVYFDQEQVNFIYEDPNDIESLKKSLLNYKKIILVEFLQCLYPPENDFSKLKTYLIPQTDEWMSKNENDKEGIGSPDTAIPRSKTLGKNKKIQKSVKTALFGTNILNRNLMQSMDITTEHFNMLLNRVTRMKFRQIGLYTRCFISSDLSSVFMVIKGQRDKIFFRAEEDRFKKQLEAGIVDLASFEPMDSLKRPFRIKSNYEIKELNNLKNELDEKTFEIYMNNARETIEGLVVQGGDVRSVNRIIDVLENLTLFELSKLVKKACEDFKRETTSFFAGETGIPSNTKLYGDIPETRENWTSFITFIYIFNYNYRMTRKIRNYSEFKKYRGLVNRLVIEKSLNDVNRSFRAKNGLFRFWQNYYVMAVWNALGVEDSEPGYSEFNRHKSIEHSWRTYQINELNDRDIFSNMENIKIVTSMINSSVRIFELIKSGAVLDFFPLHDVFIKNATLKAPLFVDVLDIEYIMNRRDSKYERDIKSVLGIFKDHGEVSDFLEKSLIDDLKFFWWKPWSVSIDAIRDYWGEKMALYFKFNSNYTWFKFPFFIVGMIVFILQRSFLKSNSVIEYKQVSLFMVCFNLVWSICFLENWKKQEKLFRRRYGISEVQDKNEIKPGFYGEYMRNPASNSMNLYHYSPAKRFWKVLLGVFISIILIVASIIISIAILLWRKTIPPGNFYQNLFPILVNAIIIIVINMIYQKIAIKLTEYENHKTLINFENSLIIKLFLFNFCNTFNSYFTIAFVKPYLTDFFGKCVQQNENSIQGLDCFNELSYQVQFLFILQFFLAVLKLIIPFCMNWVTKFLAEKNKQEILYNPWQAIDLIIERETHLSSHIFVSQLDNSLFDLLNLMMEFSFLAFFGIAFPLIGLLAFFGGVFDIQMDRYRFLHMFRRPFPITTGSLGVWTSILQMIVLMSIIINATIFCFTLNGLDDNSINKSIFTVFYEELPLCIALILCFLTFKFFMRYWFESDSENIGKIAQRHEYIEKKFADPKSGSSNSIARSGLFWNFSSDEIKNKFCSDEIVL